MSNTATAASSTPDGSHPVQDMKEKCRELDGIELKDTNKLAATLWGISISYYEDVKRQAKLSFYAAIALSILGTGFLFYALQLMMSGRIPDSRLTLAAGVIVQVISGVIFYLYAQTSKQFATFHICLERSNRFLLSNSLCENLGPGKDETRQKLIWLIATAPLLSQAVIKDGEPQNVPDRTADARPSLAQPVSSNGDGTHKHDVALGAAS